jgi:hypothetical protein
METKNTEDTLWDELKAYELQDLRGAGFLRLLSLAYVEGLLPELLLIDAQQFPLASHPERMDRLVRQVEPENQSIVLLVQDQHGPQTACESLRQELSFQSTASALLSPSTSENATQEDQPLALEFQAEFDREVSFWLSRNWSEIRDGALPELRELALALQSILNTHGDQK